MPAGEVRAHPADLVAHAGHVEAIAGEVAVAGDAGDVVRLDAGAYGQLCAMLPVLLGGLQGVLISGIDTAAGSLRGTADGLRTVAATYESTDTAGGADLYSLWDPS